MSLTENLLEILARLAIGIFYLLTLVVSAPLFPAPYLWTFDSTFRDAASIFNATSKNNATFSSASITGYGSSLSLSSPAQQSVYITSPRLALNNRSWTFEAWIYLMNISSTKDYGIIGQCKSSEYDACLHLLVRSQKLFYGHYGSDAPGSTTLATWRWYHVAISYDCATLNQSVYLDGVFDGTHQTSVCFQGYDQSLTIGTIENLGGILSFDGLIDEVSFTDRPKPSAEILRDATLTLYFSFDSDSTYDQGPLRINGSLFGNTSFVAGRVGQALEIRNVNQSYFTVQRLVLLGVPSRPYSFSIWIRPYLSQRSAIIHLASTSNGDGICFPVLQLSNTSQLISTSWNQSAIVVVGPFVPLNSWSHAAVTYSPTSGLRLYVNGTLKSSSVPFAFNPPGSPMYLFVGSRHLGSTCGAPSSNADQYSGAVDEWRVYSRELAAAHVVALANP